MGNSPRDQEYSILDGKVIVPQKEHLLSFGISRTTLTDKYARDGYTFFSDGTWRLNGWFTWVEDGRWEMRGDEMWVSLEWDKPWKRFWLGVINDKQYDYKFVMMQELFFLVLMDEVLSR
jgi:hypothetical protein